MPKDIHIDPSEEVEAVVLELINYHPHLAAARLLCVETSAKQKCQPKILSPWERFLANGCGFPPDSEGEYDAALVVNDNVWQRADDGCKAALVDHLLSHLGVEVGADGYEQWTILPHQVEEFMPVVKRHGLWNASLLALGTVTRQLALPEPPIEILLEHGQLAG